MIFLSCAFSYPRGTPIMQMLLSWMLPLGPLKGTLFFFLTLCCFILLLCLGEFLWFVFQFVSLLPAVEPLWRVFQLRNTTVWFFFLSLY